MRSLWTLYAPLGAFVLALSALVFSAGFYTATRVLSHQPSPIIVERIASHETDSTLKTPSAQGEASSEEGSVVASVNSDKFHYPWCPGAKQIKEANRIVFESAAEAISAGFTLAGNCN